MSDHNKMLIHLMYAAGLYDFKNSKLINTTTRPSCISKKSFLDIKNLQKKLNLLYFNLSKDLLNYKLPDPMYLFLYSILKKKKLLKNKNISTFFARSDYLLEEITNQYKQVEINMISLSFIFFGPSLNRIHSCLYPKVVLSNTDQKFILYVTKLKTVYEEQYKTSDTIILMIDEQCTSISTNYMEKVQIIKAFALLNMSVIYCTINDLVIKNEKVYYDDKEASVVYYRWFYNWEHFTDTARKIYTEIEFSNVICIPSVEYLMINNKLFQVYLSNKKILGMYTEDVEMIIKYFGEFKLYEEEFEKGLNENLNKQEWLRKSIKEGGDSINVNGKHDFYMKIINAKTVKNSFLTENTQRNMINEVSIFGSLICVGDKIIYNEEDGYLVRSKDENRLEGGICSGNGGLDSIELVD